MSEKILMSNGVALWLARNTELSLEQIADFCHLHPLQVHNLRENTSSQGIIECNPIDSSFLTVEEIERCEKDKKAKLEGINAGQKMRGNSKKSGVLEGALWMVNKYPNLEVSQIAKLLNCASAIVKSIKNETNKNAKDLLPKNPVSLGLCTQQEFDECILKYEK